MRHHAYQYTPGSAPDREVIEQIATAMLTQDNRATSFPIFEVRDRRRMIGVDTRFIGNAVEVVVMNDGEGDQVLDVEAFTLEKVEEIIRDLEEDSGVSRDYFGFRDSSGDEANHLAFTPEVLLGVINEGNAFDIYDMENDVTLLNFCRIGAIELEEIKGFFFTEGAAKQYIEENRHNLNNPYTYASSAWRNPEMQAVMQLILSHAPTHEDVSAASPAP